MPILNYTSTGERISESQIKARYSKSLKEKHSGSSYFVCECQGKNCTGKAEHNDHTISRARLKVLHKSELIYDPISYVSSCATCHSEWEGFKSKLYEYHNNYDERMIFLETHDKEGYRKRILN